MKVFSIFLRFKGSKTQSLTVTCFLDLIILKCYLSSSMSLSSCVYFGDSSKNTAVFWQQLCNHKKRTLQYFLLPFTVLPVFSWALVNSNAPDVILALSGNTATSHCHGDTLPETDIGLAN